MNQHSKYQKAIERIKDLKEFYQHLFVYIIFVILWLIFKDLIIDFVIRKTESTNSDFLRWLNINIVVVPVLWGIGLTFHALYVYRFNNLFIKKWEEKKIAEYMNEDQQSKTRSQHWE